MTPWDLEALVREAAARAHGLDPAEVPFVWPRHDHAGQGADAATALPPRLVSTVRARLPGRGDPRLLVCGRIAAELSAMRDEGLCDFAHLLGDDRGFLNLTLTEGQRHALLSAAAADGPHYLTGRSWDGDGSWPTSTLHEAGPVAQARRLARADARARIALATSGQRPPPGPCDAASGWRDPYLDGDPGDLVTPAGRALRTVGEASARVAFCRSIPEHPRESETTGGDLPVLPSEGRPGAWVRLTDANPAFRLRYAHAHAVSLSRWAEDGAMPHTACAEHTAAPRGLLFDGPSVLDTAARREEPHILVRYLEALASAYDEWRTCPAASSSPERTVPEPALPAAVAGVLRTGLFLLGVSAPTRL
ncbi:arginyl-tRNA synthetase [Nocardiopsis sp. Huas11]|uniref:DALR anticodon-binding domain-containing protein n=1 Tax=Nocardiopsis sp. Huas11 TaxID=2183912 RepID=UPI000EB46D78|nr:DALR anticodon-binding domain-containing protein [Nocardiopsis sp. Huas11]RKS10581.1 arginyl-tRNA synthetase [Nocardiopsis sp. Huas11]